MDQSTTPTGVFLRAVREGIVWIDRSARVRLSITGPDRGNLLQNLTTQDVLHIPIGQGAEAFVTSPQGKTIGFLTVLVDAESIVARADEGALEFLTPHFQKYGLFDDARVEDLSPATFEIHLSGPRADEFVEKIAESQPDKSEYSHVLTSIFGVSVRVVRESPDGLPGFALIGALEEQGGFLSRFQDAIAEFGGSPLTPERFEALRIEAGTPVFGKDVSPANLPQEIGRDERTLNFRKGCYLGQETVARLDSLGHVNKILKKGHVEGSSAVPPIGAAIETSGQVVGTIASSAFSERLDAAVFLAFVKTTASFETAEFSIALGDQRAKAAFD